MLSSCGRPARAHLVATGIVVASLSIAGPGRAEYVENFMAREFALVTLASAGSVALGFGVASTVYLASGPGDQTGRVVVGIGSIHGGASMLAGGALTLTIGGEENIPPPPDGGSARDALFEARALGSIEIALGAASIGVGIATLATFCSPAGEEKLATAVMSWSVLPIVMPSGGAVAVVGGF
jgi:hypothetical protein